MSPLAPVLCKLCERPFPQRRAKQRLCAGCHKAGRPSRRSSRRAQVRALDVAGVVLTPEDLLELTGGRA